MSDQREIVAETCCTVMEQLAFLFGERVDAEDLPDSDSSLLRATMCFAGPRNGSVTLALPSSLAAETASNLLGLDVGDEPAAEQVLDAMGEVLNVICGNLLTAIAGDEPVFDLTPPLVDELTTDDWDELVGQPEAVLLDVDDRPVVVIFANG